MDNYETEDVESSYFGSDTNKVRQIIGSISIILIHHNDLLSDLLDTKTFTTLNKNQHILELMSYWLQDPSYKVTRSDIFNEIENLLVTFLKRAVNKNSKNSVSFVKGSSGGESEILFRGQKI